MKRDDIFTLSKVEVGKLAQEFGSPLVVISLEQVEKNYMLLRTHLPRVRLFYAIKANPNTRILERMIAMGSSFDVASDGEINLLHAMGVEGDRMIYANPIKRPAGLTACKMTGVSRMTFDNASEIHKIANALPGATVLLRLRIDNSSAHVDLNKKFGADKNDALALMQEAKAAGLNMAGIAFHVGSQTCYADPYLRALDTAKELFDQAKAEGLDLHILDIGGGMPIPEPRVRFNLEEMLNQINARLDEDFPDTEIWAEPGRYMCGTAMNLITSVIGVTERGGNPWYYLDEGLYGTFSGVIFDQWDFDLISFKKGKKVAATFAGPSCDSLDIMFRGKLTAPLEMGDLLLVPACGAYTSASACNFNGFAKARVIIWEDVEAEFGDQKLEQNLLAVG